jgi:DcaP outer membrane protein
MPSVTSIRRSSILRRSVAVALGIALIGASSIAGAQTAKEQELERRVAELEKVVQQLMAEKKAAPAAAAPAAGAAAAAPTKPDQKAIQAGSILPNAAPGTSFVLTGYAKTDGLWTDTPDGEIAENTSGRDYYVPGATPIGGLDEGTDFDAHAKQTRINFGTDTILDGGDKVSTRFEIDFFGSSLGNQRVTNTYAPVMRHAYVQWREWLVGQTWSNFQDAAVLPDAVDFIGPTDGTVFVRQPQVRYTKGGLALSLENPQTTITPFGGGTTGNDQIETDDSSIPDITARYTWKGAWGHFSVAGLARELKFERTPATTPTVITEVDASTWSAAGSLSGKFMLGKDDIRFMLLGGNLGRYVGLNFTNDAVLTADNDLEAIDGFAGFVAYRHLWSDKWRSNLYYALGDYDNDVDLTGGRVNKSSESWTLNLIFTPLPKLDIGAEYRHAVRELESGDDGSLDRLQFTTRYSF